MAGHESSPRTEKAVQANWGTQLKPRAMAAIADIHRAAAAVPQHVENSVLRPAQVTWTGFRSCCGSLWICGETEPGTGRLIWRSPRHRGPSRRCSARTLSPGAWCPATPTPKTAGGAARTDPGRGGGAMSSCSRRSTRRRPSSPRSSTPTSACGSRTASPSSRTARGARGGAPQELLSGSDLAPRVLGRRPKA